MALDGTLNKINSQGDIPQSRKPIINIVLICTLENGLAVRTIPSSF